MEKETKEELVLIQSSIDGDVIWEKPKQETLEEAQRRFFDEMISTNPRGGIRVYLNMAIEFGVKWQQKQDKNKYSEEDMLKFAQKYAVNTLDKSHIEQFKKK